MAKTIFLYNQNLWQEIKKQVKNAKKVHAAVAYFGAGGSKLLSLKKGDILVVDMSIKTVNAGATDPNEIKKLIKKGVKVHTHTNLHAKFFLFDNTLISGSANVSQNSLKTLEEAAILTTEHNAVNKARDYFEKLCGDIVGSKYLKKCIKEYRPPRSTGHFKTRSANKQNQRIEQESFWFIGGLDYIDLPEDEQEKVNKIWHEVKKKCTIPNTEEHWIRYTKKPKYFDKISHGSLIMTLTNDEATGRKYISVPMKVLDKKLYKNSKGHTKYILFTESWKSAEDMNFKLFRKKIKSILPKLDIDNPRTQAIKDPDAYYQVRRFWTYTGRISTKIK